MGRSETTVKAVALVEGVSEGLVERSWVEKHSVIAPPQRAHVLIGLDGFCVRKPGRMWTGMWDLETKDSVAFVPGESRADVQKMLERHAPRETVRAVAIDLSEANRQAVELVLPDAFIVADKFHVPALMRGFRPGRLTSALERSLTKRLLVSVVDATEDSQRSFFWARDQSIPAAKLEYG